MRRKCWFVSLLILLSGCAGYETGGRLPVVGYGAAFTPWETSENIRVVIGTSGFTGLVHENVRITCTGAFDVCYGASVLNFRAGEIYHAENNVSVFPVNPDDRLEIIGLARDYQNPKYRGVLEISRTDGGFIIVNELPLEAYLYAVVPSEMPSSYGVEASMVQAVTARTFAVHQMRENRFAAFGAHVDDSVQSQVYNNIPENEISVAAVLATEGQILTYNNEVVLTNYFSTSGGTTANFGEVWAQGPQFPAETPAFLRARAQGFFESPGNLRTEEAAAAFFKNTEISAFDREFPWFRWHVSMTAGELSERINQALPERITANPALIHFSNENAGDIGTLINMEVTRRGQGGNIMEMVFYGTSASVRVQTEYNIRALLNPGDIPVARHDGSFSSRLSLLPSAFFTAEIFYGEENRLHSVTFYGGGNGHGVGMSQNGVRALLDAGYTYLEILRHYYPGTDISFNFAL